MKIFNTKAKKKIEKEKYCKVKGWRSWEMISLGMMEYRGKALFFIGTRDEIEKENNLVIENVS